MFKIICQRNELIAQNSKLPSRNCLFSPSSLETVRCSTQRCNLERAVLYKAARNNSIIATKLVYPLYRNTFLPARAFQTSAKGLGRAGAEAGADAGAGVMDTSRGGRRGRKMQCETQLQAMHRRLAVARQVKTGLLGKLYQVGSCYPRRDFARELLRIASSPPRPSHRAKIPRNVTRIRQPLPPPKRPAHTPEVRARVCMYANTWRAPE